ncbi:MAG: indole-3-glycerol-phosphate synthase TrpC, partial [Candidatus Thioglobus sp.]
MDATSDILQKIINRKEAEVAACKENISAQSMLEAAYKNR